MKPSRRDLLHVLAAAPLCAAAACACRNDHPRAQIPGMSLRQAVDPILMPPRLLRSSTAAVIDTHAHFFNASDVPVRGFIAESVGHNAPAWLQPLIREMAKLADKLAERAPTAHQELNDLNALSDAARGRSGRQLEAQVQQWFEQERSEAAQRVADTVAGTGFEREYRELAPQRTLESGRISPGEVLEIVGAARKPALRSGRQVEDVRRRAATAKLEFLFYMLSKRASNVRTYIDAFTSEPSGLGIDIVLGALVDFDYWLDCPPHSAHEDQIALHQHIASLHGGYLQPVVAYNPWTDIEQRGASLARVRAAWATGAFVAVKIYPPAGFMPAANATSAAATRKRRPDLKKLDDVLGAFFTACAQDGIPVIAHAARSNGRDAAHDDFSSPASWHALIRRVAATAQTPVISLGHFGGDKPATDWTRQFADLMRVYPKVRIFGDLGYWDHLMCDDTVTCAGARVRLKDAIGTSLGTETAGDRVMFATDWLMLSQVSDWQAYPERVREGLESIAGAEQVAKILGGNARNCFARLPQ